MRRIKLDVSTTSDTPRILAKLLRDLANQVERNIFPADLDWRSELGVEFSVGLEDQENGVAEGVAKIDTAKPNGGGELSREFVAGGPTLPWAEPFRIRLVSILPDHTVMPVSPDPKIAPWFLFHWGYADGENPGYHVYATDGEGWLKFSDSNAGTLTAKISATLRGGGFEVEDKPEVTYDIPLSEYLTDGDRVLMSESITERLKLSLD